jgi:hypothetical protein
MITDSTPDEAARRSTAEKVAATLLELARLPQPARARQLANLQPTLADLTTIFAPQALGAAVRAYTRPIPDLVVPGAAKAQAVIARAAALADPPAGFDRGYAMVAPWLKPGTTWVSWTYLDGADQPIRSYDGLVILADRCCYCPRPWRFLAELGVRERSAVLDHWAD